MAGGHGRSISSPPWGDGSFARYLTHMEALIRATRDTLGR